LKNESFIRWQSITREHFGNSVKMCFALATGLFAFQVNLILGSNYIDLGNKLSISFSLITLLISILAAVLCTLVRLKDFRVTAKICRDKMTGNIDHLELNRNEVKILGKLSWFLFKIQLIFFSIGATTLGANVFLIVLRR